MLNQRVHLNNMKNESLPNSLQENILTLLVTDIKSLPLLVNSVGIELFESFVFRDIATQAVAYYHEFKKPIGAHLVDVLEHILKGKDKGKASIYSDVIENVYVGKKSVNSEFVIKRLNKFVSQQNLKIGVLKAAELLDHGKVDEAEMVLRKNMKKQLSIFDPGTFLSDTKKVLRFLDSVDNFIPTGIKELDYLGICPAPKELFTFAGLSGVGKTWFFIHIAKVALLLRKKVLHITLEMSEERVLQRYAQNLFGFAKRSDENRVPHFKRDELGRFYSLDYDMIKPNGIFSDKNARKVLEKKFKSLRNPQVYVKDFPTNSLSLNELKAYLENLIEFCNFHPDIILIDEPDLMAIDKSNFRLDIRNNYFDLRGLAGEYNTAVTVVSQISKGGKSVKWIDDRYLAEDYNKMRISDNLVTYNQTNEEKQINLARLLVVKGRNDRAGDKILISQNYATGQFCLDSVRMASSYWKLPELKNKESEKDDK